MSDDTFGYGEDDDNSSALIKRLRADLKEANKRNAELDSKVQELSGAVKETELSKLFTKNEIPDKFQKLFKRGGYEPTDEGMAEFLEEWGADFGKGPQAPTEEESNAASALKKMQEAEAQARQPSHSTEQISDADLKGMNFSDVQKLMQSLARNQ